MLYLGICLFVFFVVITLITFGSKNDDGRKKNAPQDSSSYSKRLVKGSARASEGYMYSSSQQEFDRENLKNAKNVRF